MSSASVAWVERSETRVEAPPTAADPDFAEFTLGLAEGKTRGLNPGYACCHSSLTP